MKQLSKVEIGKMRQLADFLRTVPPSRFELRGWETEEYKPAKTFLFGLIELKPECGFAGCAVGWAAYSGIFDGLYLDQGGPVYKGFINYRAVNELFGITNNSSWYLFDMKRYEIGGPGYVADRLNRFADKVESRLKRAMDVHELIARDNVVEFKVA